MHNEIPINISTGFSSPERFNFFQSHVFHGKRYLIYYAAVIPISILLAVFNTRLGAGLTTAFLLALASVPVIIHSILNIRFGIKIAIIVSFFLIGAMRLIENFPLGILNDIMISLLFISMFMHQLTEKDWSFARDPVSYAILVWVMYVVLEFINPNAASRVAWLYTIRGMAGTMVMYFIISYAIKDIKFVKSLISLWLILSILAMLYGLSQEYIGLTPFDEKWIYEEEARVKLLFVMAHLRKFSFLADPAVFGFLMVYTGILSLILSFGAENKLIKYGLVLTSLLMFLAMLYTGTRAAYILIPAGAVFYSFLTLNKKIISAVLILLAAMVVLIYMPSTDANIVRFQTAFFPEKDPSYNVRMQNQKFIQPYIQSNPLGGGLGSTGEWGKRFSPNSPLANFPPDSGFVRIAVELGPIGLLIYLFMLMVIFYKGIKDYFRIKNKKLKNYSAALLTALFCLVVANFPQQAIQQIPTSLFFFMAVAIINRLKTLDMNLSNNKN